MAESTDQAFTEIKGAMFSCMEDDGLTACWHM